jgi:hypothetical protein
LWLSELVIRKLHGTLFVDGAKGIEMGRPVTVAFYVGAMIALIIGMDFAFFRNRFWERLIVNVGIVLVFAAFYSRFLRHP